MSELWLLVIAGAVATYLCRGLGVMLSGRIKVGSEIFSWVACVTYAMVAGLVMRIIVLPGGLLAESFLLDRLAACMLGLAAFYSFRRNLLVAVCIGVAVLIASGYLRALLS